MKLFGVKKVEEEEKEPSLKPDEEVITKRAYQKKVGTNEWDVIKWLDDNRVLVRRKIPKQEETPAVVEPIEKHEAPRKVEFEIFREADGKLVIIKQGKIPKKRTYFYRNKMGYYVDHILKETFKGKKKPRYVVRWNEQWSESLQDANQVLPRYSQELENDLKYDFVKGLRDAAISLAATLVLDKPMILILLMAMVFGIPIGLSYNDIFHWVPSTIVHWVTRR